jgi:hypothetical protein
MPYVAVEATPFVAPAPPFVVADAAPFVAPAPAYLALDRRAEPAPVPPATAPEPTAPPLIGPLAKADPAAEGVVPPAASEAPGGVADDEEGEPSEDAPLPLDAYPLERCARIDASIGRRGGEEREILEAQGLTAALWAKLDAHWKGAIDGETARGKTRLQKAYDAAYVAQLEEERGPITVEEHARVVVAAERGEAAEALRALELPEGALMRIRRVWIARTAADPAIGARARRALAAERDR